jgi:hypothetical protein
MRSCPKRLESEFLSKLCVLCDSLATFVFSYFSKLKGHEGDTKTAKARLAFIPFDLLHFSKLNAEVVS